MNRLACRLGATILWSTLTAAAAFAADKPAGFPERPLTMIVPYGAGGGSDQLARAMAAAMEPLLGQPVQVVNKPGGGGMAAVPDFMSLPADGYTILESIDDAVSNHAAGELAEHPGTDWSPLCITQITFSQIYVRGDEDRFSDWAGFLAHAKANATSMANVGNPGSMERVNMARLEQTLGFTTNQIAFDEPAERYAALIGGQIDVLFEQPGDVRGFLDAGQMKPILTLFDTRPAAFADVPTHREAGADFEALLRFRGFWVLPDVPQDRRTYLSAVCREAFESDSFHAFNRSNFMDLIDSYRDPDDSRKLIQSAVDTYQAMYEELGLIQ